MKIFILRHEKRLENNDFNINLTEEGFNNSELLVSRLKKINIDEIYCSPYKRVLQTIRPFVKSTNKKVFIENSLYESLMGATDINNIKDYRINNVYDENLREIIDFTYDSFLLYEYLIMNEKWEYLKYRTNMFFNNLIKKYKFTNKNILLVSHMTTLNSMIAREPKDKYEQGCVAKVYDSNINDNEKSNCFEIIN